MPPARPPISRVIVVVLDSVGIGELPDAAVYRDEGSNTLGNLARTVGLRVPTLRALGLDRVVDIGRFPAPESRLSGPPERSTNAEAGLPARSAVESQEPRARPLGAFGRMAERSPGKDSVTGHWELMGLVLDRPFPVFPEGFPPELIAEFERRIGRPTIGNSVASGTAIIAALGAEHLRTGYPIVYTSADSVFQIAAHEDRIPVRELYRLCEIAFDLVALGHGVGRVIARPFVGEPGAFQRTSNRHDFALEPSAETLLDRLRGQGWPVVSIGKVNDLFAGRGVSRSTPTRSDDHGMDVLEAELAAEGRGLVFVNLVDSDTLFGHRNDPAGYAANLERIDARLGRALPRLHSGDLLVVTADHGNDPTTPSTDHSREYVPLLVAGAGVTRGLDLGTRDSFADLGQSLAELFGVGVLKHGTSFCDRLWT